MRNQLKEKELPKMNMQGQFNSDFKEWLQNKIWVVGSGSLDCYPQSGCPCELCKKAEEGGKDRRICATSIFYKDCLFDLGPGVWKRIQSRGVVPKAIILSHVHFDHIADLMEWPKISRFFPVYTSVLHKSLFQKLGIRANYFEPDQTFYIKSIPGLKIETKVAVHTFTRPVSLLKFDDIVYAPDLGGLQDDDLKFAQGTKLWFGDGFSLEDDFILQNEKLHMSMEHLIVKLKNLKGLQSLIFLGIGHHSKYPHEDLELYLKQFDMKENTPFIVELGFDNQILNYVPSLPKKTI